MLGKLAAEKAMDAAEEHFKHQNLDMAIRFVLAAKEFNQDVPGTDELYAAYMVHKLFTMKKSWYVILGIADRSVDISIIKNHYKTMALALHPDKNKSIAAESAFKILNEAWHVISDPTKRRVYDMTLKSRKRVTSSPSSSGYARYAAPKPKRRVVVRRNVHSSSSSTDQASHDSSSKS